MEVFIIIHAVIRWQRIGLLRAHTGLPHIGSASVRPGAEKKWLRAAALAVLVLSTVMLLTFDLSMVGRRYGATTLNGFFQMILRLGPGHGMKVEYQWSGQPPQTFFTQEDYKTRSICREFLAHVTSPSVIGFFGGVNLGDVLALRPRLSQ